MSGDKTFEIRKNDRQFQRGELLELIPYDPETNLTVDLKGKNRIYAEITWVLAGGQFGIELGYAALGFRELTKAEYDQLVGPF
jgi:hypothetical protein